MFALGYWVLAAVFLVLLCYAIGLMNKIKASSVIPTYNVQSAEMSSDKTSYIRENTSAKYTTLGSGTFTVGQNIPVGRYNITSDSTGNITFMTASAACWSTKLCVSMTAPRRT